MKTLLVLALVIFAQISFAQDERNAAGIEAPQKISSSQREKREGQRFLLLGQPIGFTYLSAFDVMSGLSFGYFINPDLVVSADYTIATALEASDYGTHELSSTTGVSGKYFLFSSFFAKAGLAYRTVSSYTYGQYTTTNSDGSRAKWTNDARMTLATFAIGNQWQIHHFVIGCDYLTYNAPLSFSASSDGKPYIPGDSLEFVKFFLGASF